MPRLIRALLALLLVTVSVAAQAAPRDKAADKKIQEAVFTHFLNTDFDTAEGLLLGTIRACEDKCSPSLIARAWMYVGVVRGAGRNDMNGAKEAFKKALAADPAVALDTQVANDPVKEAFAKLRGNGGAAKPAPAGPEPGITCVPELTEVESRRPVPLQCESSVDLDSVKLHYKSFDGTWAEIEMTPETGAFRGTIPCSATKSTGTLRFYVEGLDARHTVVAGLGTKQGPKTAQVVSETSAAPPAFPGEEPPQRCGVEASEPDQAEHKEGCGAWGGNCGEDGCCDAGLACVAGKCESAECKSESDCDGAPCVSGKCEHEEKTPSGPGAKNWVGLHFGADIAAFSADNACDPSSRANHIACYSGGTTYEGQPSPTGSGKINGGLTLATMRALLSYERLFGAIGLEGRLGFAFNGGPTPNGGTAFLPVHVEARAKYWLLGEHAAGRPGLRPWIHLGGGLAQVDATVKDVQVADCTQAPDVRFCLNAPDLKTAVFQRGAKIIKLDVVKQLGLMFVTVGGGAMFALGQNHGVVLNLNAMVLLPSSGFVLEPSLGYAVGF